MVETAHRCTLQYFELAKQVGQRYHFSESVVCVDGYCRPDSADHLSLGVCAPVAPAPVPLLIRPRHCVLGVYCTSVLVRARVLVRKHKSTTRQVALEEHVARCSLSSSNRFP